jgi:hypothetical protein
MFWQSQDELNALAAFRADRRLREELNQELADFRAIFWDPASPEQQAWAGHMIRSIEHELHQLDA